VRPSGFTFQPIGFIESDLKEIQRDPAVFEGTLARFERLYVIFVFDRAEGFELVIHPRGDLCRPERGVFATQTPNRPNALGLSVVELVGVKENIVTVRGLDAIDGTPVLDIKPCDDRP
jgi:tRNA-Thr(GGU) m(6)t(6)A37 methyltransferase TsaA